MASSRAARQESGTTSESSPIVCPPNAAGFFGVVQHLQSTTQSTPHSAQYYHDARQSKKSPAPSTKRQRVQSEAKYVPLGRKTIMLQAEFDSDLFSKCHIDLHPVNEDFSFHRWFTSDHYEINRRRPGAKSKGGGQLITVESLGHLTEVDETLLMMANRHGEQSFEPGHLWTCLSLGLHIEGQGDGPPRLVTLTIELELRWNVSPYVTGDLHTEAQKDLRRKVLQAYYPGVFPDSLPSHHQYTESWSPQDFYAAAHVPSKATGPDGDQLQVPGLTADLFPFQRRAVKWLLQREGVSPSPDETFDVVPYQAPSDPDIISHFVKVEDADGEPFFISELFGIATRDPSIFETYEQGIRGGILSEEMGLGKTVEMISLILLHPQSKEPVTASAADPPVPNQLRFTEATLIVTPPALKKQWISELERHSPNLRVMVYTGIAGSEADEKAEAAMVEKLRRQDVVITTYSELSKELHFAIDPPERSRRNARKYHRPRSPLVQLMWWRVCLDEAQEIESGVSNAANVLRVIPRINSWGVTGTPVKDGVEDLWGLLLFLRYEPYASFPKIWRQLTRAHKALFKSLFGRIALRHTKRTVGSELALPPQKRYVITMPFTAVEEQHYQGLFQQLSRACGLNTYGAPLEDNWNPDDSAVLEAMRSALDRLRKTTLHPEIGEHNRRALGHRAGPMRTVAEVLDAMIGQSASALLVDKRTLLNQKLKRGQLLENSPRVKVALEIWQKGLEESKVLVQEARERLRIEVEKAEEEEKKNGPAKPEDSGHDDDDEDKGVSDRLRDTQRDLRYALEIQHKAEFFVANAYFQIKSNEEMTAPGSAEFKELEKLEIEGYEKAKSVRQEILQESRSKAMGLMDELAGQAESQNFASLPECIFEYPTGIEGRNIGADMERLVEMLDTQADQIDDWREAVIQLLLKDLVDEDEGVEITGDEYENSTKVQDEIQAYLTILKLAISDRNSILTGIAPSGLTLYEERQALQMAGDGDGPAPELMLQLYAERERYRIPEEDGVRSLRAAMVDLRDIATRLRDRANRGNRRAQLELECISAQLNSATKQQTAQLKANTALDQEVTKIRTALNRRIAYYRQLQIVSDMVALYEGEKDDAAMAACIREEEELRRTVATTESKHKYLVHLKEADANEESRLCVICQCTFSVGVLTVCGHRFCKECITLWFRAHHNCPMCKRKLNANNLHDIILKPQELKVLSEGGGDSQEQQPQQTGLQRTKKTGIYSDFNAQKLEEIKNIDLPGPSFTTKIDTLVRHLLWLRASDPGAKTIIFSQFPDFLSVIAQALTQHQIGHSRYTNRNGISQFQEDPSIECFLLHARAHSSGLNLVNASHVILCEPLLNTALELQAIARVHRIGQKQQTTVWLYIVDGTVEESIYNLSVQRRMEHMGRNLKGKSKESTPELLDSNLELANSLELQEAQLSKLMSKGKMSGEEVAKGDLWTCLFGNLARQQPQRVVDGVVDENEDRLRNNLVVRRYLAANAAEERQQEGNAMEVDD